MSDLREEFEKWVIQKAQSSNYQFMGSLLNRFEDGYATSWVDSAWLGWQACRLAYLSNK